MSQLKICTLINFPSINKLLKFPKKFMVYIKISTDTSVIQIVNATSAKHHRLTNINAYCYTLIAVYGFIFAHHFFRPTSHGKNFALLKIHPKMSRLKELGLRTAKLALSICLKMKYGWVCLKDLVIQQMDPCWFHFCSYDINSKLVLES